MLDSLAPLLWACLTFTVPLTILSFGLGLLLGLASALFRMFGPSPLSVAVRVYVWIIRGTPLLVQLFLIFYGLPSVGILLDAFRHDSLDAFIDLTRRTSLRRAA